MWIGDAHRDDGKRFVAIVFGRTRTRFPLHIRSTRELTITEAPVVTVVGKAFGDLGHAPNDNQTAERGCSNMLLGRLSADAFHVVE
jgi:hypothetical protein